MHRIVGRLYCRSLCFETWSRRGLTKPTVRHVMGRRAQRRRRVCHHRRRAAHRATPPFLLVVEREVLNCGCNCERTEHANGHAGGTVSASVAQPVGHASGRHERSNHALAAVSSAAHEPQHAMCLHCQMTCAVRVAWCPQASASELGCCASDSCVDHVGPWWGGPGSQECAVGVQVGPLCGWRAESGLGQRRDLHGPHGARLCIFGLVCQAPTQPNLAL